MTATASAAAPPRAGPAGAAAARPHLATALLGLMLTSASGAVVALGDTLFRQESFAAGFAADFDPAAHFLIRLRIWHPVIAAAVGVYLISAVTLLPAVRTPPLRRAARLTIALVCLQVAIGLANVLWMAPLGFQMAHLLAANLVWIATVWIWLQTRPPA